MTSNNYSSSAQGYLQRYQDQPQQQQSNLIQHQQRQPSSSSVSVSEHDQFQFHNPSQYQSRQFSNESNSSSRYSLDNSSTYNTNTQSMNNDSSRINLLEEKIQQLEKALALSELNSKNLSSESSIYSTNDNINSNTASPVPVTQTSIPPPVPSPPSNNSSNNSPLINNFKPPLPTLLTSEQRKSKSIFDIKPPQATHSEKQKVSSTDDLIPGKSLLQSKQDQSKQQVTASNPGIKKTHSYDSSYEFDLDEYKDEIGELDEPPPPSYSELEQSGSLTYSQSIYRTGFEKAGYNSMKIKNDTKISGHTTNATASEAIAAASNPAMAYSPSLRMKRKLPPPLPELQIEAENNRNNSITLPNNTITPPASSSSRRINSFDNSKLERPTQQFIGSSNTNSTPSSSSSRISPPSRLPVSPPMNANKFIRPTQKFVNDEDNTDEDVFKTSNLPDLPIQAPVQGKRRQELLQQQQKPLPLPEPIREPFKIDPRKAKVLENGVIQPILPSESKESLDNLRKRFIRIRERAYNDYKRFTPKIQFDWAIMLLESLDKPIFISKVSIDGSIRKTSININSKELNKEKFYFLDTAVKVLNKIVEKDPDSTRARLYLGDIYSGGIHSGILPKDEAKGYQLFLDAATKQNDPVAYYRVACCLEVGVGTNKNLELAYKYLNRASILGDPSAMCQLGVVLFVGNQFKEPNIEASIELYEKAVEKLKDPWIMGQDPLISTRSFKNSRDILFTLAKIYQTDKDLLMLSSKELELKQLKQLKQLNILNNFEKSLYYYLEAAKIGHGESQTILGFYYKEGCFPTKDFKRDESTRSIMSSKLSPGTKSIIGISPSRSIYWYAKAAENNEIYAAMGLAKWYASGVESDKNPNTGKKAVLLEKDPEQAFLWMKKAADLGAIAEAQYMVGKCFQQGFGTYQSEKQAVVYYRLSAQQGHHMALQRLKDITGRR